MAKVSKNSPILSVSVAAELAGMHAQTVRQYDRLGLVVAKRTKGGGRRYSLADVDKLVEIQRMSQEDGINLAGILRILELTEKVEKLTRTNKRLQRDIEKMQALGEYMGEELARYRATEQRVFAAGPDGDVTIAERIDQLRKALRKDSGHEMVVFRPRRLVETAPYREVKSEVSAKGLADAGFSKEALGFDGDVDDFESLGSDDDYVVYDENCEPAFPARMDASAHRVVIDADGAEDEFVDSADADIDDFVQALGGSADSADDDEFDGVEEPFDGVEEPDE
ncbi:heat shock protein transcriptional repressor HspR [Arcanobacterium canis]